MSKITGVVICQNEEHCITKCLDSLFTLTKEIVVVDGKSVDKTAGIIRDWEKNKDVNLRVFVNTFRGHFADQKNLAIMAAKTEWVFVLDADETLEQGLAVEANEIVESNNYDAAAFPRYNYINKSKTDVYPDFQHRLFRSFCRYIYPVHEELVGYRSCKVATTHIIHDKTNLVYKRQQNFYDVVSDRYSYCLRKKHEQW